MNLLEATQNYSAWSGRQTVSGKPAVSKILADGQTVNIFAAGDFTIKSQIALAVTIRRAIHHKSPRNLILNFASTSGEYGGLRYLLLAIERAKRRCNVLAKIDAACGPALYAALHCELVYARPAAPIGHLGYWFADIGSADVPALAAIDLLAQLALVELCPKVPPATWARLMHHHITGEQAEALGIVDGLRTGLLLT